MRGSTMGEIMKVKKTAGLVGTVHIPGDKSISHRKDHVGRSSRYTDNNNQLSPCGRLLVNNWLYAGLGRICRAR